MKKNDSWNQMHETIQWFPGEKKGDKRREVKMIWQSKIILGCQPLMSLNWQALQCLHFRHPLQKEDKKVREEGRRLFVHFLSASDSLLFSSLLSSKERKTFLSSLEQTCLSLRISTLSFFISLWSSLFAREVFSLSFLLLKFHDLGISIWGRSLDALITIFLQTASSFVLPFRCCFFLSLYPSTPFFAPCVWCVTSSSTAGVSKKGMQAKQQLEASCSHEDDKEREREVRKFAQ